MNPNNTNTPLLPWRTRAATLGLARGFAIAAGIALITGLAYRFLPVGLNWNASQVALVTHLVAGVVSVLIFLPFLVVHLQDGRESLRTLLLPWRLISAPRDDFYRQKLLGLALVWSVLLTEASGLLLSWPTVPYLLGRGETWPYGLHIPFGWLHLAAPLLAVAVAAFHFRKRIAGDASAPGAMRPATFTLAGTTLAVAVAVVALPGPTDLKVDLAATQPFYSRPWGDNPFFPAEWKTEDKGLANWRAVPGAMQCVECHRKETLEWASSLHAVSGKDVVYDTATRENVQHAHASGAHGMPKGRWCESCHEPLGVLTGVTDDLTTTQETAASEEGTNCIACHTAAHPEPLAGNAAFTSRLNTFARSLDPALIMAAPAQHARDMQAKRHEPVMGKSDFCGPCHTEIKPPQVSGHEPMNLQDTYDEWRRSKYAEQGVQCQHCHMAQDPPAVVAALKRGERPEHRVSHRFVGNNYLLSNPDLPGGLMQVLRGGRPTGLFRSFDKQGFTEEMRRQHELTVGLLRQAAELRIVGTGVADGVLNLSVGVKNAGAGHALPTGPLDQRYLWLELKVTDADGKEVFHQGRFDGAKGAEDPRAVRWIKQVFDAEGKPITRHILFDADRLFYPRKPILPGAEDMVPYRVELPAASRGPFAVEAKLWYRLALQDIVKNIESQTGKALDVVIPPLDIAEANATLDDGKTLARGKEER